MTLDNVAYHNQNDYGSSAHGFCITFILANRLHHNQQPIDQMSLLVSSAGSRSKNLKQFSAGSRSRY